MISNQQQLSAGAGEAHSYAPWLGSAARFRLGSPESAATGIPVAKGPPERPDNGKADERAVSRPSRCERWPRRRRY
jgi:hypothetical protein